MRIKLAFIPFAVVSTFLFVAGLAPLTGSETNSGELEIERLQQRQLRLQALRSDTVEVSAGAQMDLEIQRNPALFRSTAVPPWAPTAAEAAPARPEEPSPLAPPLNAPAFDAINFDENAALNGFFQIPPDPSGAAGPSHVVNVTNSAIEWYTKAGVRQNRQSLASFFSTAVPAPATITFDPKVLYDHYAGRFVVTTMERVEASGATPNQSRVYFAVSDDNDPNGTWFTFALTTEEVINGRQTWADFPGLAVDSEAIYYTNNQFAHNNQTQAGVFQGQRLRIIRKDTFYTGGVAVATSYDPTALANAPTAGGDGAIATTMQPTYMYGDTPGGLGTFLIAYSGLNDFVSGSDANLFVQVIRVDNPLGTPTFTGYFSQWGTIQVNDNLFSGFPGAPQSGTTRRIATNDRRFSQHGVYRNGLLYAAAPILEPAASSEAGQVHAHYFVIDPATIATTVSDPPPVDQGDVSAEDVAAGTFTFFPTVAVGCQGDLAIGFAASAPSIFPGAYYTMRLAADPAGTVQATGTLKAGVDYYIRDFTTSMTVTSRWGDYTGIWLDPTTERTFWVFNEYALTRGTILTGLAEEDGRWGNAWGSFTSTAAPCAPPASFPTIFINDVIVTEGNAGSTNASFLITLSAPSTAPIFVNYSTADGTAQAGQDYTATSGSLTFNPGETSKTVNVPVLGDTLHENTENFFLNLTTPAGATFGDPQGEGTINDNDAPPSISINDVAVAEGNSGSSSVIFTVTFSAPSGRTATVDYSTANGTATTPEDYSFAAGTLTFAPGDTTKSIAISVNGDTIVEPNETFFVNLMNATASSISDGQGQGTINNDDVAPTPTPTPTPTPSPTPIAAQPQNLASRAQVGTTDRVMIGGFIVTGNTPLDVLIRGLGPSLAEAGLTGVLQNPRLDLYNEFGQLLFSNQDWKDTQEAEIRATGIPPTFNVESAMIAHLPPGSYTAVLQGVGGGTGLGLIEIYDIGTGPGDAQLGNLSTRALVGTGQSVLIGGFILGENDGDAEIVVRALGPSLAAAGVSGALADPFLELRDSNGLLIQGNDNWTDVPGQATELTAKGFAPSNNNESAIIITLPPGTYTAIVRGTNASTGVGLVEIFHRQ